MHLDADKELSTAVLSLPGSASICPSVSTLTSDTIKHHQADEEEEPNKPEINGY